MIGLRIMIDDNENKMIIIEGIIIFINNIN